MPSKDFDDDNAAREDLLAELLDLIRGTGKYRGHGSGLLCGPGEPDWPGCRELERRGLARRGKDGRWEARPGLRIAD